VNITIPILTSNPSMLCNQAKRRFRCCRLQMQCSRLSPSYHSPFSISAATTARSVFTPAGRITETDKSTTGYINGTRNILHCMHCSSMGIIIASIAIWLHFFLACIASNVETLPTARLIGVKRSTPRLHYCTAISASSFVSILFHSFPFN